MVNAASGSSAFTISPTRSMACFTTLRNSASRLPKYRYTAPTPMSPAFATSATVVSATPRVANTRSAASRIFFSRPTNARGLPAGISEFIFRYSSTVNGGLSAPPRRSKAGARTVASPRELRSPPPGVCPARPPGGAAPCAPPLCGTHARATSSYRKTVRILVVEDDQRLARFLERLLVEEGYSVDRSANGADAVAQVGASGYDLVLLDWMIPELDGIEVCRQIRRSGSTVPILMLTARDQVSERVHGLDAGADDYLVKPFEVEELLARIH